MHAVSKPPALQDLVQAPARWPDDARRAVDEDFELFVVLECFDN